MKHFSFIAVLLLFVFELRAQKLKPELRTFPPEMGITASEVYQTYQDSSGYVWAASVGGVFRYNGKQFKHFSQDAGLPESTVLKIVGEFPKGKVWFQTISGKFFTIEKDSVQIYEYNAKIAEHIPNGVNNLSYLDKSGNLYISYIVNGMCIKINAQGELKSLVTNSVTGSIDILDIYHSVFTPLTHERASRFEINKINIGNFSNQNRIISLKTPLEISNTAKPYLTEKGVFLFENSTLQFIDNGGNSKEKKFSGAITSIMVDESERLFVSTINNGFFVFENYKNIKKPTYHFLSGIGIGVINQDREKGYWIATLNNGLFYLPNLSIGSFKYQNSEGLFLSNEFLIASNHFIYFALSDGSLHRVNGDSVSTISLEKFQFPSKPVFSNAFFDKEENLLIAPTNLNRSVVFKYDEPAFLTNEIRSFLSFFSNKQKYLMGGWFNIMSFNKATLKRETGIFDSLLNRWEYLVPLDSNTILAASINGLYKIDLTSGKPEEMSKLNPLYKNRILKIVDAGSHFIFLVKDKGLMFAKKDNLKNLTTVDNTNLLSSGQIRDALFIDGNLFASTTKGLLFINDFLLFPDEKVKTKLLQSNEGLLSNNVYSLSLFNGFIYLGTDKGVCRIPEKYFENTQSNIPFFIENIYGERADFSGNLPRFKYTQDRIIVNYNFISAQKNESVSFRYKLSPFGNNQWIYTDENHAEFTNVTPGNYSFVVSYSLDGKIWSEEKTIAFEIIPAFYQTLWFLVLVIILISALLAFTVRKIVLGSQAREMKKLALQNKAGLMELKALRAQMNPHFIFNVITSIQNFNLNNDSKSAYKYLGTFAKLIRNVLHHSETPETTLKDEEILLSQYIELERMRFSSRFDYTFIVAENIDKANTLIPSMFIQPIVENAIKHGVSKVSHTGLLEIEISKQKEELLIQIKDNGPGINSANKTDVNYEHKSMATKIFSDRVNIINEISGYEKIRVEVIDISEVEKEKTGTLVRIFVKTKPMAV